MTMGSSIETASQRDAARAIFRSGVTTLAGMARALQEQGVKTPSGASKWHRTQVSRLLAGDAAASPLEPTKAHLNSGLNDAAKIPPDDAVPIEITADHVFLPTGDDGNVGPGWETAGATERVKQGRRLLVSRAMADWLRGRKLATILPAGASIPPYVRP